MRTTQDVRVDTTACDVLAAIDAFEHGTVLISIAEARVRWCSPAFSTRFGERLDATAASLESLLPGFGDAFAALRGAAARQVQRWTVTSNGPAQWLEAQLVLAAPDCAVLRLADPHEQGRATQRHLADRERLLFTSRAVSVGEMASTVAHELNQPIGAVVNVLRGMQSRLAAGSADAAVLGQGVQLALEQALYASRVIARIREYTLSRQPRRDAIDLVRVVRDALALLDWELQRREVRLELQVPDTACPTLGDEVMLQQLLVNLLRNGLEAMNDAPPTQRRIEVRLTRGEREAEIALRDTGCGLPSDGEARLFVPFQSSKPDGMGIGLNICRSFVELHQGRLWFSRPADGLGSVFHVGLPLHPDTATQPHRSRTTSEVS